MQQKKYYFTIEKIFCGAAFILGFIKEVTINNADSTLILANNVDNVYNNDEDISATNQQQSCTTAANVNKESVSRLNNRLQFFRI